MLFDPFAELRIFGAESSLNVSGIRHQVFLLRSCSRTNFTTVATEGGEAVKLLSHLSIWRRTLLILVFFSALLTPGRRELIVGDETKYGQVVREMRTTGAFFLPTLNGAPFTHKPPLHFWLVDLLTFPLGRYSMWAFVIPSLLAFAFLLWLLTRMRDWLAAFVCGTSVLVWGSAQTARMDISFTAFLTLACWLLFRFFESHVPQAGEGFAARSNEDPPHPAFGHLLPRAAVEKGASWWLLWSGVTLAIATLIKGPMALVIALVLFVIEC